MTDYSSNFPLWHGVTNSGSTTIPFGPVGGDPTLGTGSSPSSGAGVTDTSSGGGSGGFDWNTFAKLLGAGISVASALAGASNQSKANSINQGLLDQLAQQRQMGIGLGKIGAVGNPFSGQYGSVFGAPGATAAPAGTIPPTVVPPVGTVGGNALNPNLMPRYPQGTV